MEVNEAWSLCQVIMLHVYRQETSKCTYMDAVKMSVNTILLQRQDSAVEDTHENGQRCGYDWE
jgi:hypothetical protein